MSWFSTLWNWLFPPPKPPVVVQPVPPPPPPVQGKKKLFSATINGYPSSPLQGCGNDGKNMANYLGPKGFEVHRLQEELVTGVNLESYWRQAVRETKSGDLTVLHFSGHGANGPSGLPNDPGQCMVTVDMRPFYASRLGKILDEELAEGANVVIVLDCCHSETGSRLLGPLPGYYRKAKSVPWHMLDISQDPVPSLRHHRYYNLTALARSSQNGIIEFAACQANDVTWDANINGEVQGCFTRAVIDAATELDELHPEGYTVIMFQRRVRTKLPNDEFPNQPQLLASDEQVDQVMWRTS